MCAEKKFVGDCSTCAEREDSRPMSPRHSIRMLPNNEVLDEYIRLDAIVLLSPRFDYVCDMTI